MAPLLLLIDAVAFYQKVMRNKTKKLDILKTKTGLVPKELKPLVSRKKPREVYVTFPL